MLRNAKCSVVFTAETKNVMFRRVYGALVECVRQCMCMFMKGPPWTNEVKATTTTTTTTGDTNTGGMYGFAVVETTTGYSGALVCVEKNCLSTLSYLYDDRKK